jgi:hypothetical protein
MAAVFQPPVKVTATTGLTDIGSAVPSSTVRSCDLRVANVGAADVLVDVFLLDPLSSNSGYRAKNFLIPYQSNQSAIDMELGLVLPAGWKIQVRASVGSAAEFTMSYVEDAA